MKGYLSGVLALMILVGALGLPPRHYEAPWWARERNRTPERARFLELQNQILQETWLHQRIQWRDSVSGILQDLEIREHPYWIGVPEWVPDSLVSRLHQGVSAQLRAWDALPPQVPVGVFMMPRREKLHPSAYENRLGAPWHNREFYVARQGESPYCALLEPVGREGAWGLGDVVRQLVFLPQDPNVEPNALRICGYYARYGMPGPEVEAWLRKGAAIFASGINRTRRDFLLYMPQGPRGPFGLWTRFYGLSPEGMACIGGKGPACRNVFLIPKGSEDGWVPLNWDFHGSVETSPVDFLGYRYLVLGRDLGVMTQHLFSDLEREFGVDRFARFWRSPLPVDQAFLEAFGKSPEAWVMTWAQGELGTIQRGPGVPLQASVLSLATILLFGGVSLFMGRRRA